MRFAVHGSGAVGGIKIDWDAPVERGLELRDAMAPHPVDTMRVGVVLRGFAVANVTYPRGTIAVQVGEGHELFLQLPVDPTRVVAATRATVPSAWSVEPAGSVQRHRGTVGTEDDGERIDVIIASRAPGLSRARVQQLIEAGQVTVAGQQVKKPSRRLQAGDRIELELPSSPAAPDPGPPGGTDLP